MALLLADENFPAQVVIALRKFGHDVVTLAECGHAGQSMGDREVLLLATNNKRALLTINRRHFIRLHLEQVLHEGIIACTFDADFQSQAERIHLAIESYSVLSKQLIRINRPQA